MVNGRTSEGSIHAGEPPGDVRFDAGISDGAETLRDVTEVAQIKIHGPLACRINFHETGTFFTRLGTQGSAFRRDVEALFDMPERMIDLLFRFLHRNGGRLS